MKTWAKVIVMSAVSGVAGWYAFDNTPEKLHAYLPSGPELVPGFSLLTRAGIGCGVAVATLGLMAGVASLVRSPDRGRRALVLVAVAGWSLVGLLIALAWSLVDASQTFLARPNLPGLYWAYVRAAVLGLCWTGAVTAVAHALHRWWPATRLNHSPQQTGAFVPIPGGERSS